MIATLLRVEHPVVRVASGVDGADARVEDNVLLAMPRETGGGGLPAAPAIGRRKSSGHSEKLSTSDLPRSLMRRLACVARPVNRREIAGNERAQKAMKTEVDRLRQKKVWEIGRAHV